MRFILLWIGVNSTDNEQIYDLGMLVYNNISDKTQSDESAEYRYIFFLARDYKIPTLPLKKLDEKNK